ncbi:hypothetical protein ON010_g12165 [Phytophthora cinnamomi]|nr:hypothetical protein ON010_g12165 [Phytophthora cinnamomi]
MRGVKAVAHALQVLVTDPAAVKAWLVDMKAKAKHELDHYWLGTKLLYADVSTSTRILRRLLKGNALSRPRAQAASAHRGRPAAPRAVRVLCDRPVHGAAAACGAQGVPQHAAQHVQGLVPARGGHEAPAAAARGAGGVPSGHGEGDHAGHPRHGRRVRGAQGDGQRGHELRGACAAWRALDVGGDAPGGQAFQRRADAGQYLAAAACGHLRNRIRQLKKDDQDIIWEGLDSLDKEELQMACMERGMRATGLTKAGYVRQMRQWLDLSINKNVPASLLIMSRALNITAADNLEEALATSMSSMDEEVVTEVALAAKTSTEETPEMRKLKLDSIRYQNEMIADEEKFRDEAQKKETEAQKQAETDAAATQAAAAAAAETQTEVEQVIADVIIEKAHSQPAPASGTLTGATETKFEEETPAVPKTIENIVSLEELSALESLAFKSLVEKERQTVSQLKQNKYDMDVEGLLAAGRIGAQAAENKTAGRMMKKLESMLSNLEVQIEEVDRHVGDRLNILDRDSDGVLSAEELRDAVMTILRKANTQEDVEWVISLIDEDNDGKIALEELVAWIAKCRESLEATGRIALQEPVDATAETSATAEAEKAKADKAEKAKVKRANSRKKKEKEQ